MKNWIQAARLPSNIDLAAVSGLLYQQGIAHRITEEQGLQVIWVERAEVVQPLNELLERVLSGEVSIQVEKTADPSPAQRWNWQAFYRTPATYILIGLSILGYVLGGEKYYHLIHWLTYQDFTFFRGAPLFTLASDNMLQGQLWRLVTPIFLHFGLFHILFNGLWVWELGRRIEEVVGAWRYLNLVLLIAVLSNTAEYLWQGPSVFGGMSGVIYGLLGYIWQRHRLAPDSRFAIPPGLIGFMLLFLVICMSGVLDLIAQVKIANAAHLSGLVVGMVCGVVAGLRARAK